MNNEMSAWLLSRAKTLRAGDGDSVNIKELLRTFGIQILFEKSDRRSGALSQNVHGEWFVVVRGKRQSTNLSAADRFTAAHELGHYLLIKHWQYAPSTSNKKAYYGCEELCNQFASQLLLNHEKVASLAISSPQECLGCVRDLAKRYSVSTEAAARAIVETHFNVAICAFGKTNEYCWKRLWGVSSLNGVVRFGSKQVKSGSILEEMTTWVGDILGNKPKKDDLDFATETVEFGVSGSQFSGHMLTTKKETATSKLAKDELNAVSFIRKPELAAILIKKPPVGV